MQIKVKKSFAVTSVDLDADPNSYSGDCAAPISFDVDAEITASSQARSLLLGPQRRRPHQHQVGHL